LFTSEGCSSCPPADRLLQELDRSQPAGDKHIIVLSEHVDYWNHIGWTDPFSSKFFSHRQEAYANHFGIDSVYTPEMVVDGNSQFVGNDSRHADQAIEKAGESGKLPIHITSVFKDGDHVLHAHIEAGKGAELLPKADVLFAVALDHAESQVLHGENEGRRLTHVSVVLQLTRVSQLEKGKEFDGDVQIRLDPKYDRTELRAIAFLQEPGPGRVLGADLQLVAPQAAVSADGKLSD